MLVLRVRAGEQSRYHHLLNKHFTNYRIKNDIWKHIILINSPLFCKSQLNRILGCLDGSSHE